MNDKTKARNYNSPVLQDLLNEISPIEMKKTQNRMMLAANIEDLIIKNGWTKSQFAEKVGKNKSEITKWLSGTQNLTIDTQTEIAEVFGIDVSDLLNRQKKRNGLYTGAIVIVKHIDNFTRERWNSTFFDCNTPSFSYAVGNPANLITPYYN